MPNTGTLDTLRIEIEANSKRASDGVGSLVGSLRHLAKATGTALPSLRALNRELKTLVGLKGISIPSVGGAIAKGSKAANTAKEIKKTTEAIKEQAKVVNTVSTGSGAKPGNTKKEYDEYIAQARAYQARKKQQEEEQANQLRGSDISQTDRVIDTLRASGNFEKLKRYMSVFPPLEGSKYFGQTAEAIMQGASGATQQIQQIGNTAEESAPKVSKLGHVLSRIGRIASTMIIRAGLKSLMKAFSESWEAAYAFSNKMGGSFAKSIDQARTMLSDTATTVIQTVGPVFQAMIPVINVISGAIQFLCQQIQNLLSLLGLSSDLFGANTQAINKNIGASNKNASSKKNLLASWDELNVIQSQGGGSGGGSGYKPGSMKDLVQSELAGVTSVLVGEALLAVGLIMAFTGHPGIGIALAALGATAIVKPIIENWGKMSEKVKREITNITLIAGASMLALGAILLLSGAGTGLGIAMLIAGGLNLATAVALNWDSIVSKVSSMFNRIKEVVVDVWNKISTAVSDAWTAVSTWFDENIVQNVSAAWDAVFEFFSVLFAGSDVEGSIANYAYNGWEWVKGIWTENILPILSGAWDGIVSWFGTLFGGSDVEGSIAHLALAGWEWVKKVWTDGIAPAITGAWDGVTSFFSTLFGNSEQPGSIACFANDAIVAIENFWTEDIVGSVSKAWQGFTDFFAKLFGDQTQEGSISHYANQAWEWLKGIWTENILTPIQTAWNNVLAFFTELWGDSETGICGEFSALWAEISCLWGDIITNVQTAWQNVGTWFHNNVTAPVANFFIGCVNSIIDGVNWIIEKLNTINITIPAVSLPWVGQLWEETKVGIQGIAQLEHLAEVKYIEQHADGAYGIPKGDLFIANEAGAELVGNMNGKTTVANQGQIIEGIQRGVRDANQEQNDLLRRQNDLLMNLLEKSGTITVEPSAAWGRFNQRSAEMWGRTTGR